MEDQKPVGEQEQKLQQEILSDAQRRAARVIERAKRDAEKAVKAAQRRREKSREARLRDAEHIAEERCRVVTANIEHEKRRQWLLLREQQLEGAFGGALAEVEGGTAVDRAESLRQLAMEAAAAIGSNELVLRVRPEDRAVFSQDVLAQVADKAQRGADGAPSVRVEEDEQIRGGVIVLTADGRKCYDNTYAARLRRMKRDLRAALCPDPQGAGAGSGLPQQEKID
jgi:vacuolar-type H+-ATPase subunit E/Vma4